MPAHDVALKLIEQTRSAIAAPSANLFGQTSPTTPQAVKQMLSGRIDGIINGGNCTVGVESTIVSFCEDLPVLYRAGGISYEDIVACIGRVRIASARGDEKKAPGRTTRHYAPSTPLYLHARMDDFPTGTRLGLLGFGSCKNSSRFSAVKNLSFSGSLREAATNLYAFMRSLDAESLDAVMVSSIPDTGLGRAINDRLRRASEDGFL
jgi:L-threonylcarbamoyladenylate synthase